jgi:hypothetical protein
MSEISFPFSSSIRAERIHDAAVDFRARSRVAFCVTDKKSLLALRAVGPEFEAESVRFHGRMVTM